LAAGADFVMTGSLFAGAKDAPGTTENGYKVYRGSASKESYETQGKTAEHRTPEGIARKVKEKDETAFDIVKHIKKNWSYYKALYTIDSSVFRNDFAFSIAIHMMGGKNFATPLPGKMNYILDRDILIDINQEHLKFLVEKNSYVGEYTAAKTTGLDVHVMNKYSLTRCIECQ
jgi:hypothetical protein